MLFALGALMLLVVAIGLGRFWLSGNWFACSVMFFPATVFFLALIFGVYFSGGGVATEGEAITLSVISVLCGFLFAKAPQWYRRRYSEG